MIRKITSQDQFGEQEEAVNDGWYGRLRNNLLGFKWTIVETSYSYVWYTRLLI